MGLANLYYILQDYKDRQRTEALRGQESAAANWLENFQRAGTPDERDLRMSQLPNVVSDPTVRTATRGAADQVLLQNFAKDAAPLLNPSKITGKLPSKSEASRDILAFAQDQNINPLIALKANEALTAFAQDPKTPEIKTFGGKDEKYVNGQLVDTADNPTTPRGYLKGQRYTYIGTDGKTKEGTYQGLDPTTYEPQWSSVTTKADTDSGAGSASNDRLLRQEGVKSMQGRLFAEAVAQNPEIAELDKILGKVDSSIKYDRVRSMMTPEIQDLMDQVTERAGELTLQYKGNFEKAANEALKEFRSQLEKLTSAPGSDAAKRFADDQAMKDAGYTLGTMIDGKGYEVYDKSGKLIGYYD